MGRDMTDSHESLFGKEFDLHRASVKALARKLTATQQKLDKATEALEFYAQAEEDAILLEFHENQDINAPMDIGKRARAALASIKG